MLEIALAKCPLKAAQCLLNALVTGREDSGDDGLDGIGLHDRKMWQKVKGRLQYERSTLWNTMRQAPTMAARHCWVSLCHSRKEQHPLRYGVTTSPHNYAAAAAQAAWTPWRYAIEKLPVTASSDSQWERPRSRFRVKCVYIYVKLHPTTKPDFHAKLPGGGLSV